MTTIEQEAQMLRRQAEMLIEKIEDIEKKFGVEVQIIPRTLNAQLIQDSMVEKTPVPRFQISIRRTIEY